MAVDAKWNGRSPDAGKEQHTGVGTKAQATERGQHPHKPGAGDVFKSHVGANGTNNNAGSDLIPDLGG